MQKEIVQPVSADTGAIEQSADNPSPCAPLTPSAETRYLKAMEQTDRYHCRYNPSYALLDNAEPAPVIPAALFRSGCPATHSFCQMRLQWLAATCAIVTAAEHALSDSHWYAAQRVLIIDNGHNPLTTAELVITAYITGTK